MDKLYFYLNNPDDDKHEKKYKLQASVDMYKNRCKTAIIMTTGIIRKSPYHDVTDQTGALQALYEMLTKENAIIISTDNDSSEDTKQAIVKTIAFIPTKEQSYQGNDGIKITIYTGLCDVSFDLYPKNELIEKAIKQFQLPAHHDPGFVVSDFIQSNNLKRMTVFGTHKHYSVMHWYSDEHGNHFGIAVNGPCRRADILDELRQQETDTKASRKAKPITITKK